MTQSNMQRGAKEKENLTKKILMKRSYMQTETPPALNVVLLFHTHSKYRFTCRHPSTKNHYLELHSGDEGMPLTSAPCMPMSPGLPGNPG